MEVTSFYKKPVHEIVNNLPESAVPGFRCIDASDNSINEFNDDGSVTKDTDFAYGAICAVIGRNASLSTIAHYINGDNFIKRPVPYFNTGNFRNVHRAVYWGDKLVVARQNTSGGEADLIVISPNGDSKRVEHPAFVSGDCQIMGLVVDSFENLWVSTSASGILKFSPDNTDMPATWFRKTDGSHIFEKNTLIHAKGSEIWVLNVPEFSVSYYDGEWHNLTEKFLSDLSLELPAEAQINAYTVTSDDSGDIYLTISCTEWTNTNLIKYDGNSFTRISTPSEVVIMQEFVKLGNKLYLISGEEETKGGKLFIVDVSTNKVNFSITDMVFTDITTNGETIIAFSFERSFFASKTHDEFIDNIQYQSRVMDIIGIDDNSYFVDFAISATNKVCVLNFSYSSYGISTIIENIPSAQWVVV